MIKTWSELKKRRYEEINLNSHSTATLTALIEHIASSFGDNTSEFDPIKFLPIKFNDDDSNSNSVEKRFKSRTLKILMKLKEQGVIPAKVMRDLYRIEGLYEFLNNQK